MTSFDDLGLAEPILRAVTAEGYTQPTPIQAQGIPAVLTGRDLLGIAQTGTGKTAAFVLPILHRIALEGKRPAEKTSHALIVVPTRELAEQIGDSIRSYSRFMRVTHAVVIGGANPRAQAAKLARGVDIIVATPGRLLDHMNTRIVTLSQTTQVVLDEADQMLDMGFIPAIRQIMAKVNAERQTMLFSATMPKEIRKLADDFMKQPLEVSVAPTAKPIETIDQCVMHLDGGAKRGVLVSLLRSGEVERAIVFTRTKRGADKVAQTVARAGFGADALHGNKSQGQRQRTLDSFRSGKLHVLIATDIAARGIDIDDISHVINFDLPHVPESYVHRIGRTARAGKSGSAISLCGHDERRLLRDIEKLTGKPLRVAPTPEPAEVDDQPARFAAPAADRRPARYAEPAATGERPAFERPAFERRTDERPAFARRARYEGPANTQSPEAPVAAEDGERRPRRPARNAAGPGGGKSFGKPSGRFAASKPKPRSAEGGEPRQPRGPGGKPGGAKTGGGAGKPGGAKPDRQRSSGRDGEGQGRGEGNQDRGGLTRMLGNPKAA